jgi:hypothetical protein
MRIIISNKVKEWQQANPEEVRKEPRVIQNPIDPKPKSKATPRYELTQFGLQAPAKYMEYETKNGADSNLLLYSMAVKWAGAKETANA